MPWKLVLVCAGCDIELDEGAGRFLVDTEHAQSRLTERARELNWETYDRNWHCPQCVRVLRDFRSVPPAPRR